MPECKQRARFAEEYAPPALKSIWLAIFLMAIPVGYALGYIYGAIVGTMFGWRLAFMSEATMMLPFVIFAFRTRPVPLGKDSSSSGPELTLSPLRSTSPVSYPPHPDDTMHPSVSACDAVVPDADDVLGHSTRSMRSTELGSKRSARGQGKSAEGGSPDRMSPVLPPRGTGGMLEAAAEHMSVFGDGESLVYGSGGSRGGDGADCGHGGANGSRVWGATVLSHRGAPGLQAPLKTQVRWMLRCCHAIYRSH